MAALEQLGSEKYVLLTTFRRDGRGVPTPVWVAPDGGGLGVWTVNDSGKVKRIRNGGRVTLAPCDMRGKPTGEPVEGQARIGDAADVARIGAAVRQKYGLLGRLTMFGSKLRRGATGTAVILVQIS